MRPESEAPKVVGSFFSCKSISIVCDLQGNGGCFTFVGFEVVYSRRLLEGMFNPGYPCRGGAPDLNFVLITFGSAKNTPKSKI